MHIHTCTYFSPVQPRKLSLSSVLVVFLQTTSTSIYILVLVSVNCSEISYNYNQGMFPFLHFFFWFFNLIKKCINKHFIKTHFVCVNLLSSQFAILFVGAAIIFVKQYGSMQHDMISTTEMELVFYFERFSNYKNVELAANFI